MFLLYIILFLMGYLLGQLDDLEHKLPIIGTTAVTLSAIILGSNMIGLMLYDRFNPAEPLKSRGKIDSRWHSLIDSLKLFRHGGDRHPLWFLIQVLSHVAYWN